MKTNFEIEDNYAVQLCGTHIDLHNNFEFNGWKSIGNNVIVEFTKLKSDREPDNEFDKLNFIHKNVSFKFYENGNNDDFPEDENTLSVIGFFPQSMRDINDGFMDRSNPEVGDDIIYIFQNDKTIRIGCDEIELKVFRNKLILVK